DPFSFSFDHRFSFEAATSAGVLHAFDGGVIELSQDAGNSWTDIGSSAAPGYNVTLDPGNNALASRRAYGSRSYPAFSHVTVNLGTAYANQDVRVRFSAGTDENTGGLGWELDNFAFTGITNKPFVVLLPNAAKNITGSVNIALGGYRYNAVSRRFSQVVTLTNNTGSDIQGPVSFALDNLSANAAVVSPNGFTAANPPLASPYLNVSVGSDNTFSSGESATVVIQFDNPTRAAITYTPRVLAGSGPR